MRITILSFLTFLASLCCVLGFWQFIWIYIHKRGYELEKHEGESFPDFLFRWYDGDFRWKLRKLLVPKWFYYSRMFLIFVKVKGILLIVVSIVIALGIILLKNSEFAPWLEVEF